MSDPRESYGRGGMEAPAYSAAAVSPDDNNDLTLSSRALYVGGGGDLKVTFVSGEIVTFSGVLAGTILPIRVERVHNSGTDATNIIALL